MLFASIMETLGNEALGKIINIVDEAKMLVELESGRGGKRPQTSILNILNTARVGMYTGPPKFQNNSIQYNTLFKTSF